VTAGLLSPLGAMGAAVCATAVLVLMTAAMLCGTTEAGSAPPPLAPTVSFLSHQVCTQGALDSVCLIQNVTMALPTGFSVTIQGSGPEIRLVNASIVQAPCQSPLCFYQTFSIKSAGRLSLTQGSRISVPSLDVQTGSLFVDDSSVIDVSAMGYDKAIQGAGQGGGGGSHGGQGSTCGQGSGGASFGSFSLPRWFGGPGSVFDGNYSNPRGGGVLFVSVQEAVINGQVLADGGSAPAGVPAVIGGAAGGSMYIYAPNLTLGSLSVLSVAGGDSASFFGQAGGGGGGGGGRIGIQTESDIDMDAFVLVGGGSTQGCSYGGTATLYAAPVCSLPRVLLFLFFFLFLLRFPHGE